MSRKDDPDFIALIEEHVELDEETGQLKFTNLYASIAVNIGWKGGLVVVPYSHLVWLKKYGVWPKKGFHVDHINDNSQDNRPENLQELTEADSQKKRRGRMIYRSYGKGKYGYGFNLHHDKRDGRYYLSRYLSRGHGDGDLKNIRKGLGGYDSLEEAEVAIKVYSSEIEANGLDYIPNLGGRNPKEATIRLERQIPHLRELRKQGHTYQEIADMTGFSMTSVYNKTKDVQIE